MSEATKRRQRRVRAKGEVCAGCGVNPPAMDWEAQKEAWVCILCRDPVVAGAAENANVY